MYKRMGGFWSRVALAIAMTGGCAVPQDNVTESAQDTDVDVDSVPLSDVVAETPEATDALNQSLSCSNFFCNPNNGGTGYCQRVLQEKTARCWRPSEAQHWRCCYP